MGLRQLGTKSSQTRRWREMDSNFWYRGTKAVDFRSIPGIAGVKIDEYTVEFSTPAPDAFLPHQVVYIPIASPKQWETVGGGKSPASRCGSAKSRETRISLLSTAL
jgi:hypothetical protein